MDTNLIGALIRRLRTEHKLTQRQLALQLNVSDKAVSKWETGKSCPDVSIMLELCGILGITVNELLSGERITMENYQKKAEENLIRDWPCHPVYRLVMFVIYFVKYYEIRLK